MSFLSLIQSDPNVSAEFRSAVASISGPVPTSAEADVMQRFGFDQRVARQHLISREQAQRHAARVQSERLSAALASFRNAEDHAEQTHLAQIDREESETAALERAAELLEADLERAIFANTPEAAEIPPIRFGKRTAAYGGHVGDVILSDLADADIEKSRPIVHQVLKALLTGARCDHPVALVCRAALDQLVQLHTAERAPLIVERDELDAEEF